MPEEEALVRIGADAGARGGQEDAHGIVVPVPLPLALPRKRVSSDSGKISASALRYRRLRTAFIRGLYLQLIVRNHWTEETGDGAADAKAKAAGEKRKRGSEVGSADDNTSQPGSGVPPDGVVAFSPNEIADWMFNENGKTVGGYMLRVFKTKFPEDWDKVRYGEKIQFKE